MQTHLFWASGDLSQLEQFGTQILVSSTTRALLREARTLTPMPAVRVKGRTANVEVFSLG